MDCVSSKHAQCLHIYNIETLPDLFLSLLRMILVKILGENG